MDFLFFLALMGIAAFGFGLFSSDQNSSKDKKSSEGDSTAMAFHTKIVGVTHTNPDGLSRQDLITRLNMNSPISLQRDYANIYDPNAIAVVNHNGQQLGFLNRELAASLALKIDAGENIKVSITALSGRSSGYARGVNILVHT